MNGNIEPLAPSSRSDLTTPPGVRIKPLPERLSKTPGIDQILGPRYGAYKGVPLCAASFPEVQL